jgi:hypothetical protein
VHASNLDEDQDCLCSFAFACDGSGVLVCEPPCGGDFCVCRCGGEMSCPGCRECDGTDDDYFDGDDQ